MTEKMESIDNKTCPLLKELKYLNMGFLQDPNMEKIKAPEFGKQNRTRI